MRNPYILLFVIVILFRIATALPVQQAGYMDASYAMHVAENLARGHGFVEDVLWNYLDQPTGLPHPSNLYWMPLPSLLIFPFYTLLGISYRVAQIPFVLLSSLLPLFAFRLSRKIFSRDDYAWASAIFTAFSGFYTIYWISPDNFTLFAVTGSLCLFMVARGIESNSARYFFVAGFLAALSHLSRADGILLLAVPPLVLLTRHGLRNTQYVLRFTLFFLLAYLFTMFPWFLRNYLAVGSPYPSAGTKTLWLTNYDDLFHFADDLTFERYLAMGWWAIAESKIVAAFRNLLIISFGDLQLFLTPFAVVGWWQLRKHLYYLPFTTYFVLLYLAMTLAFTFPSWRGSLFHSAAALLPFLAVAVPPGIEAVVNWIASRRKAWDANVAARFFRWGFVALAIFFSIFFYAQGIFGAVIGGSSEIPLWNDRDAAYPGIARWLDQNARAEDVVMVVDPPTFHNLSHRRAIMIPTDGVNAVFGVSRKYGARYLILEYDRPKLLSDLYLGRVTIPGLKRVADFRDASGRPAMLFEISQ